MTSTRATVLALAALALGCSRKATPDREDAEGKATARAAKAAAPETTGAPVALDAIAGFDDCALGHRGVLLDLGDATSRADIATRADRGRVESIERDGATWARVVATTVTITFTAIDAATAPIDPDVPPVLEARVRGGVARSVTVFLNGKAAGVWPLVKGETSVVSMKLTLAGTPNGAQVISGSNELLLKFNSPSARGGVPDEQAEIDWIHIGPPDREGAYGAPTRADVLGSVTIGGVPKRALSLRSPGFARCGGWLPNGGTFTASVGLVGGTDADAEVRLLRDRVPPVVLASVHLGSTEASSWRSVAAPLGDLGTKDAKATGTLGAIELVAARAARGTRIVFGEPRVIADAGAPPTKGAAAASGARGVVLVVLGDFTPRLIDLYGGRMAMPAIGALAKAGITFDAHRASSGFASGALASMLTGVSARAHGVVDEEAALPSDVLTLADAARQAGVAAAMFTANPTTGASFGFARGWDELFEQPPSEDNSAASLFGAATRWIEAEARKGDRFLAVVHARGGHPPWDATIDDLKTLPPADYAGGIDPKHAAELLAKARHTPPQIRLTDADRARAFALYALALRMHDAAIGRLFSALKAAGIDDRTLVVITGDVAEDELGRSGGAPDATALEEATLTVPLIVRPPAGSAIDSPRATFPTTSQDVATTILDALGLTPPTTFQGMDLLSLAAARPNPRGRPLLAELGPRFTLRWGSFVLAGQRALSPLPAADAGEQRETKLCDLSLEPACVSDVRGAFPLALDALHRATFGVLAAPDHARTPAVIDAKAASSLKAWGRP